MFKNLLSITLFLVSALSINAQGQFGVRVSAGQTLASEAQDMVIVNGVSISHDLKFIDFTPTRSIGFFAKKQFGFLFAQSDVSLSSYKTNFEVQSYIDDNVPNDTAEETNTNIDLSVIGGVSIKNWSIGVGPVFHKTLDFDSDLYNYEFYSENKRNLNAGFQAMVAYSIGPVTIDVRYEDMFSNVGDHIYLENNKSKFKSDMNAISIGLGIGF